MLIVDHHYQNYTLSTTHALEINYHSFLLTVKAYLSAFYLTPPSFVNNRRAKKHGLLSFELSASGYVSQQLKTVLSTHHVLFTKTPVICQGDNDVVNSFLS